MEGKQLGILARRDQLWPATVHILPIYSFNLQERLFKEEIGKNMERISKPLTWAFQNKKLKTDTLVCWPITTIYDGH